MVIKTDAHIAQLKIAIKKISFENDKKYNTWFQVVIYLHNVWQGGKISGRTSHMLDVSHWSHQVGQDNLPLHGWQ